MAKLLNLPDTARSIVYSVIVFRLKTDPILSALSPPIRWMTYLGEAAHQLPYSNDSLPAIEIVPVGLPAKQEAQTIQDSPLGIRLILTTSGLDVRDLLNLWGAVEYALFPGDGTKTLANTIRAELYAASQQQNRPLGSLQTINLSQPGVWAGADVPGSNQLMTADGYLTAMMTVPK